MKVKIIVEQFDNGVSLRLSSPDFDDVALVVLDRDRGKTLGDLIWTDVSKVMNDKGCNVVTINIEYDKYE